MISRTFFSKLTASAALAFAIQGAHAITPVYVSTTGNDATGDGTVGNPYATIKKGTDLVDLGGAVNVAPGVYDQLTSITRRVTVQGTAGQTTITAPLGSLYAGLIDVGATSVSLKGLSFEVNQPLATRGVIGNTGASFDGLDISDCVFYGTGTYNPGTFSSGVTLVGGATLPAWRVRITASTLTLGDITGFLYRGFDVFRTAATIGGPTPAEGNSILSGVFDIRLALTSNPTLVQNNTLLGAGLVVSAISANTTVDIADNVFEPLLDFPECILFQLVKQPTSQVRIHGNLFLDRTIGVWAGASQNTFIYDNTFSSQPGKSPQHLLIDSATDTAGSGAPYVLNSVSATGNVFQGAGTGIYFNNGYEANYAGGIAFSSVVIGGPGAQANTFESSLDEFARANNAGGSTWRQNVDFSQNLFEVAPTNVAKLPAAMNAAELADLENGLFHKPDDNNTGYFYTTSAATPGIIYVNKSGSDATGDGSIGNPFLTIGKGLATVATSGTVIVGTGDYAEGTSLTITRPVSLLADGPTTISKSSPQIADSLLVVAAADVTVDGFGFLIDQPNVRNGLFANGGGFDRLLVQDCAFFGAGTNGGFPALSCGVRVQGNTVPKVTLKRNFVGKLAQTSVLYRGFYILNIPATVGGPNPGDGNTIDANVQDVLIQAFSNTVPTTIENNTFYGAGIDVSTPNTTVTIAKNRFSPTLNYPQSVLAKYATKGAVIVDANVFDVRTVGVNAGGSVGTVVTNNTFNVQTGFNPTHLVVDSLAEASVQPTAPLPLNSIKVQGNTFNPGPATAMLFQNGRGPDYAGMISFSNVTIGGAGALANTFNCVLSQIGVMDGTTGFEWVQDIDISKNLFCVGSTPKLPTAMSPSERAALEDLLVHKPDNSVLGYFYTYTPPTPNVVYVSKTGDDLFGDGSVTFPFETIVKGVSTVVPGGTVIVQTGVYDEGTSIVLNKPLTLVADGVTTIPSPAVPMPGVNQLVTVTSASVTVNGFCFIINQPTIAYGIRATEAVNFDNLAIRNCCFFGTGVINTVAPSAAVELLGNGSGTMTATLTGNTVSTLNGAFAEILYRGFRLRQMNGTVGGPNPGDGNDILAAVQDVHLQFPSGGPLLVQNNLLRGAGVDVTEPNANSPQTIIGNVFDPNLAYPQCVVTKYSQNSTAATIVTSNTFYTRTVGVAAGGSRFIQITDNVFRSRLTSGGYNHILVNSQPDSGTVNTNPNGFTITGNTFGTDGSTPVAGARGIQFSNGFQSAGTLWVERVLGGAGALANTFECQLGEFISLDPNSGTEFQQDIDARNNLFGVGSPCAPKLPSTLNSAERAELQGKLYHKPDNTADGLLILGLVTEADLTVTKTVSASPVTSGSPLTFTVTVFNNGADTATNVDVTDVLDSGLSISSLSVSGPGSASSTGNVVTLSVPSLPQGQSSVLTIDTVPNVPGSYVNTATADSDTTETNPADNASSVPFTVTAPTNLSVVKTVSDDPSLVGEPLTFTIVATNNGPYVVTTASLTDSVDPTLQINSVTATDGVTTVVGQDVSVAYGDLAPGQSTTVTIQVVSTLSGLYTNTAVTTNTAQDTNAADDTSSVSFTILDPVADLSIVKTASESLRNVGDTFSYTLDVYNAGPNAADDVVVTDTLPALVNLLGISSGTTATVTGQTVVADLGTVPAFTTATFTLTVGAQFPGTAVNTAFVASPTADPDSNDLSSSATTVIAGVSDLSVSKSASPTTIFVGDSTVFTIDIANAGPSTATLVQVSDVVPAGLTVTGALFPAGSVTVSGNSVAADLASLAPGASATLTVTATGDTTGVYVNTATVDGSEVDPNATNDSSSATVTVLPVPSADLSIVKTADVATAFVGDPVVFTLAVANAGPDTQTSVTVTDAVPAGFVYVSSSSSQGSVTESGGTVTADLGSLASGSTATVTINVTAAVPGTYDNVGVVAGTLVENTPADNSSTATVTVNALADLQVTKSASPTTINVGDSTVFTIAVSNNGPSTGTTVQLSDVVPTGLTVTGASFPAGSVTVSGNSVTADLSTLAPGDSATLTVTATGDTTGVFTNTANVDGSESDPNTANDSASAAVTVLPVPSADLSIVKTADVPVVTLGNPVEFTLAVSNAGPDTATSVTVTDAIPAGFNYQASSSSQGSTTESAGVVTAELGSIAAGSTATVTIFVRGEAEGTFDNVGVVSGNEVETNPADNSSTATVQVIPVPPATANLTVTKVASDTTVGLGGVIFYAVTVSNAGPGASAVTSLADVLPSEVTFSSATLTQGSFIETSGVIAADLGVLNPGASATLIVKVVASSTGTAVNTASAAGSLTDPDTSDNSSSATVLIVQPVSDLSIVKTVDNATPAAGASFNYTLLVTNNGPETNYGVAAFDSVPAGIMILSATSSAGSSPTVAGQDVSVDIGVLDPGATASVNIQAQGNTAGTYFNTGSVTGAGFDSDPTNDSSTVQVDVLPITNLSVLKTASVTTATLLAPFTYTITVTNIGSENATSVTVSDILPATVVVGTINASQGTFSLSSGVLTVDFGTINSADTATVTVEVTPQTIDTLTNTAVVQTTGASDSDPSDDTSVVVTPVAASFTPVLTDDYDTTGGVNGETGWGSFAMNTPGFAAPEYDQAAGDYKARIAASPDKFRVTGVRSLGVNSMLYSNVGADKYVRVKYYLYAGDQTGDSGSVLNEIPALRVRASNRFAVTSLLEVFSQTERDPFTAALANELRPSADPAKPSIYRVDFDPIDTPYLVANPTTEKITRAFEAYSTDPSDNGYIAMTESIIGTYPAVALPDSATPTKVYSAADLADAQTIVTSQTIDFTGATEGSFGVPADPTVVGAPTYAADPVNGVTLDTTAVTTDALAVLSNEFYAGASAAARVRVEEGKVYKVRFHLTSTLPASTNSSINLRVRTIKFSQTQRLVVGGSFSAGGINNLMAQEALPGVGSLNPDQRTVGENGGWYNVLVNSIMDRDIRPELAPGAPLSDAAGMPLISAEPGPGQTGTSLRDIKIGIDLIDTISGAPLGYNEAGNVTCDTVEIRTYNQIND